MSEKAEQTYKEKHLKDWKTITLTPLWKSLTLWKLKKKKRGVAQDFHIVLHEI